MNQIGQIEAVKAMQKYIEIHLKEPIALLDLAKVAGYSPWHAAKIFKAHTAKTPFEYMRDLRLSQAALTLRDHENRVLDVAFDYVFDSHEGFTRAFAHAFGVTPSKYRKQPSPIPLFMPYLVSNRRVLSVKGDVVMSEEVRTVFTQVIEKAARKLLLKRGLKAEEYFAYCDEVGCDVWGMLCSVKEALGEPMGIWLPEDMRPSGTSRYVQGVELPLDYAAMPPEGYEVITMPATKMMVFQGEPYDDEVFMGVIGQVKKVIDHYDPSAYGFKFKENGMRFQLEPQGYRGYIEGKEVL